MVVLKRRPWSEVEPEAHASGVLDERARTLKLMDITFDVVSRHGTVGIEWWRALRRQIADGDQPDAS